MKYFISLQIPNNYKNRIEMLRAEFNFFTTEPHITLVPPPDMPDDEFFIKEMIEICKTTQPFIVKLEQLGHFRNKVLYIGVNSSKLINLHEQIYERLNLNKEIRKYVPHLTIVKHRPGRPINIDSIKKRAEKIIIPAPSFNVNSLLIYQQPKEKSIYLPYMRIPFGQ